MKFQSLSVLQLQKINDLEKYKYKKVLDLVLLMYFPTKLFYLFVIIELRLSNSCFLEICKDHSNINYKDHNNINLARASKSEQTNILKKKKNEQIKNLCRW